MQWSSTLIQNLPVLDDTAAGASGLADPQQIKHVNRVGREQQAGADFAKFGRAFTNESFHSVSLERYCRSQSADTTASDQKAATDTTGRSHRCSEIHRSFGRKLKAKQEFPI